MAGMTTLRPKTPLRVLILEDSPVDAQAIAGHLSGSGYQVESRRVETEAGFLAALKETWDIILSDYSLPEYSCDKALDAVKKRGLEIPVIVVSGHVGEELAVAVVKAGAADFVSKDRLSGLGPTVKAALAQNQLRLDHNRAVEALRLSEAKFRSYLDNAPIAVFVFDHHGRIVDFNRAALDLTGHGASSLANMTFPELHPLEDRRGVFLSMQELVQAGRFEGELPVLRRDGQRIWVTLLAVKLDDQRSISFMTDVTERRRAAAERQELEAQYRQAQKMEAIGRLAGGVAHDFNNMLGVISGYSSSLLTDELLSRRQRDALIEVSKAADRAAALTRQLLLFSRKQAMELGPVEINEVIAGVSKMLQRILGEDVELDSQLAPDLPLISADVGMIEQVLLNLAVNSRDAMPHGGKVVIATAATTLDLAAAEKIPEAIPGRCVRLSLSDTGSGIAPEVLPRIFEPFFTTKEVGKGTGLGLATVHGIVKQHRGWISVESVVGQGTTFHLFFPALAGQRSRARDGAAGQTAPIGNETILLVEDEQSLRLLISNILERCGYTVLSAATGKAALDLWEKRRGDIKLLLTDIVIPDGMTGIDLALQLCARDPALKVVYTSGYPSEAGAAVTLTEGVNFLQKPCAPLKLAQTVRARLDAKA